MKITNKEFNIIWYSIGSSFLPSNTAAIESKQVEIAMLGIDTNCNNKHARSLLFEIVRLRIVQVENLSLKSWMVLVTLQKTFYEKR